MGKAVKQILALPINLVNKGASAVGILDSKKGGLAPAPVADPALTAAQNGILLEEEKKKARRSAAGGRADTMFTTNLPGLGTPPSSGPGLL